MMTSHRIEVTEESQVGAARRCVAEWCQRLGHGAAPCGAGAIVATELARNMVRHGGGGELIVQEVRESDPPALELLALDKGPGMANVAACMRDGYSSMGTAGGGMGAAQRMADRFEVHSLPGRGTAVWARFGGTKGAADPAACEVGAVSVPLAGQTLCGDAWEAVTRNGTLRIMVADGLGHGPFAEEASHEALAVFRRHPEASLTEILELAHLALAKTRGAAAAIVEIRRYASTAANAGVGNISIRLQLAAGMKNLISDNGTLGASMRRVQQFSAPWEAEALLVMHSDGIGTGWNLTDYPGLMRRHPSLIAGVIYRDFGRRRDDATVVVARQGAAALQN